MKNDLHNELAGLLVGLQENSLTESQKLRLNQILKENSEMLDVFHDQLYIDAMLQWHFGTVGLELPEKSEIINFKAKKHILMGIISLAACLLLALGLLFWGKMQSPAKKTEPVSVKLASGWEIIPSDRAVYEIVSSTSLNLKQGELFVESVLNSNKAVLPLSVETVSGTATAKGTSFYIGAHNEKGEIKMSTGKIGRLTRVLVLSGVVTLSNALGMVTGTANELLTAKEDAKPTKEVVNSNSDFAANLKKKAGEKLPIGKIINPYRFDFFGIRGQSNTGTFILCIDASKSMFEGNDDDDKLKGRVNKTIDHFVEDMLFDIVIFSENGIKTFRDKLVFANKENKEKAKAFINDINSNGDYTASYANVELEGESSFVEKGGSRIDLALAESLKQGPDTICILSGKMTKQVSFADMKVHLKKLSDKYYHQNGLINPIIHTVGYNVDKDGGNFLKNIAKKYKGKYRRIRIIR